ncbi:MAG: putative peptidoglycan glycosyltransferase FtsW [Hyphomicrobiaceae bacterium]|nr:putative peptidoglycan glycosyltransferase FtsW [Hyphomicrobiaceae bacterium]
MRLTRSDRSLVAEWWFTVDRQLLAALLVLIGAGLVLSLAASPAVAVKKGLPPFYFAERHFVFAGLGMIVMLAVSALTPRTMRRVALVVLVASIGLMVWGLVSGVEIKGARRWVHIAGHSLQPSEIGKPALVVLLAWLFSESAIRKDVPALPLAMLLGAVFAGLLLMQPDVGQTLLLVMVWGSLLLLSGQPLKWALMLAPLAGAGFGVAWLAFAHVRSRVARFIDPSSGDTYQTDRAIQSFTEGGLMGRGPGEGTIKSSLPDAHTDFIFAVIGEEYGAVACLALLALYGFVAVAAFRRAWREPDVFVRLAVIGLALLIVLQAVINMGVNVGLLPAKGMTLPFISAGGSSSLATSLAAGFLLGLTRRRPGLSHLKKPQLRSTLDGVVVR